MFFKDKKKTLNTDKIYIWHTIYCMLIKNEDVSGRFFGQ